MKVICIKSKTFYYFSNYGGTQLKVEKGKLYECLKDNFGKGSMIYYLIIFI